MQARCHRPVPTTLCCRCGREQETLAHVLNHCHYNLGMVRDRHNSILERIVRAVPEHMGTKMKEQPLPGTSGANRPDLTIISPDESSAFIVEVCCPFEGSPTALEDAARSKVEKYQPLRQTLLQRYTSVEVLPFIVGSLGSWYPPNDRVLSRLHIGWRYASLMRRLCVVSAIAGSQTIWYQSMCTQRRMPLPGGGPAAAGDGPATAEDGPAARVETLKIHSLFIYLFRFCFDFWFCFDLLIYQSHELWCHAIIMILFGFIYAKVCNG